MIDGIYTIAFVELLRNSFPGADINMIYVKASASRRLRLLMGRTGYDAADAHTQLVELDAIKEKVGLKEMLRHANTTIENAGSAEEFISTGVSTIIALIAGGKTVGKTEKVG